MKSYHDDEAKYEASRLSHNIYYETQFSCSSLRVFLDSLPGVVSIYATVNIIDGITHYELSSIQVNFNCHIELGIIKIGVCFIKLT